jgi:hypothetical protein
MAENGRAEVLQQALEAILLCNADPLPKLFTENVSGWGPNMLVSSLGELTDLVAQREDALSDVSVHVDALDVVGTKGFVEYRVSARFSQPFTVTDDVVIEPNGRTLLVGAALVAEFAGDKISAFRNYFDDVTLLEQMLVPA